MNTHKPTTTPMLPAPAVGRSGTLTVAGATTSEASDVTVQGYPATRYLDRTFSREGFSPNDGTNTFTAIAHDSLGRWDTNVVSTYLPATLTLAYDANGNLRTNGTRILDYDDENQLTGITEANAWKTAFVYDGKMRRRERWEAAWDGSRWVTNLLVRYVYDGMLVVQERHYNPLASTTLPTLVVNYTRGLDLSGSLQGAGGIGGLLARTEQSTINPQPTTGLYYADNVGNVTTVVGTNGLALARYLYEPFGNIIAMSGPWAERNLHRFSSKEWHDPSSLVYYGYRYYNPSIQRWINRDPIGERGGRNLYAFVLNCPTIRLDGLGLLGPVDTLPSPPLQIQVPDVVACIGRCTALYDPLNAEGKFWLTLAGGSFPFFKPLGVQLTTIPSWLSQGGGTAVTGVNSLRCLGLSACGLDQPVICGLYRPPEFAQVAFPFSKPPPYRLREKLLKKKMLRVCITYEELSGWSNPQNGGRNQPAK